MMPQAWFEMAEIRRRMFAESAWIPLRAVQPICEGGNRGHLGYKEEFFGAGSLAVPADLKEKANKLGWSDVGISHEHRACFDDGRYIRLSDAHLPGSELPEAIKLAGIDSSGPELHQGQTLISNCASAAMTIATLLERLLNSTCEELHGKK